MGKSSISSRKMLPVLAISNNPFLSDVALVKEPFT